MKMIYAMMLLAGVALSGQALADAKLAQDKGCMVCHDVATKKVGPAYKEVAAKYKGKADAPAKLVAKVKAGGSGVWGAVPMPPQTAVSEADLKKLVAWVLTQK